MATAGDGATPYQSGGAGGKFRKRPIRRSAQATPYDRPSTALRNKSPSLFSKLVDPASRLLYAGADRLFGVFRKRLPAIAAPRPRVTIEEPEPSTNEGGNLAGNATEISDLENMLKQKTFTKSEIEHLTALLNAKTSDDEGDKSKLPSPPSTQFLRLQASTSSQHIEERENIHAAISTSVITSRAIEEDVASPAELARAYMGTITPKVSPPTSRIGTQAPRHDSALLNTTTILPKTPITSLAPRTSATYKGLENGLTMTPRSRGRSAIYSMARTPYYRPPSTFNQKGINSPSLPLSNSAWEQEESMARTPYYRPPSTLNQKGTNSPSLPLSYSAREQEGSIESSKMAVKRRSSVLDEIGSGGPVRRIRQKANLLSQGSHLSRNRSEYGQKLLLRNEPESKSNKATEENGETSRSNLGYTAVPTKSTQMATKILEQLDRLSPKEKSPGSRLGKISEQSPSKLASNSVVIKEKVDSPKFLLSSQENKKPEGLLTESTSQSKGKEKVEENGSKKFVVPRNVLSTMNGNSDKGPIVENNESVFKLPVEPPQKKRFQMSAPEGSVDVDEEKRSNGHVSFSFGQNKKPEMTSVFATKTAEVIQTTVTPQVNNNKSLQPQVDKVPEMVELKKNDNAISPPKTDSKSLGVNNEQKVGFNFTPSPPPTSNNSTPPVIFQSTSVTDTVSPPLKKAPVFPTFGLKNTENNASPFSFSANNGTSGFKTDAKPVGSTSLFSSVKENSQEQVSPSKKDNDENGNAPKSVNIFGKSEFLSFASPTTQTQAASTSAASGILSFGAKDSSITTNGTPPTSTPSTNNLFSSNTITSNPLPTSAPQPVFSFGSNKTTETTKETKSDTTTTTTSTSFGFSSPSTTNGTTGFNTCFGGTTTTSSSLFGSSTPAITAPTFGLSSSSSTFTTTPSFGLTSSETKSNMFTSTFGSATSTSPFSFGAASTTASTGSSMFSFTSSNPPSQSQPIFGNSTSVFGTTNNDQMGMAEDNNTPSPSLPAFGQPTTFSFGSTTPPPSTSPFQFGGQTSQPSQQPNPFQATPSHNPFQASGSGDFSAGGGSFSLGSGGGGDKSGRRILKVKRGINRRK